jgi:hypothetical protein
VLSRIFDSAGRLVAVSHHLGMSVIWQGSFMVLDITHSPHDSASQHITPVLMRSPACASASARQRFCTGKNPYGELDVLGSMPQSQLGEWESMMNVSGYHGMPSFKVADFVPADLELASA